MERSSIATVAATIGLVAWSSSAGAQTPLDGFHPPSTGRVLTVVVEDDGAVLFGGERLGRLGPGGPEDPAFALVSDGDVRAMVRQADGKVIVGGGFTHIGGSARGYLARINADGTLDFEFQPAAGGAVNAIAVQDDGRIVAGGEFGLRRFLPGGEADSSFVPEISGEVFAVASQHNLRTVVAGAFGLVRLNAGGSRDAGFSAFTAGTVRSIALQVDAWIVIGGEFAGGVTRLRPDGSRDAMYAASVDGTVRAVAIQLDGQAVIGGEFTGRIARLTRTGRRDEDFHPAIAAPVLALAVHGSGRIVAAGQSFLAALHRRGALDVDFAAAANNAVWAIATQPDGRVLLGGQFTMVAGVRRNYLARLNADGTIDSTFNPGANDAVYAIAVQPDGGIVVGGSFTTLGGGGAGSTSRQRIGRLTADGAVDLSFDPGANNAVTALALQSDGGIVAGGLFTAFGGGGAGQFSRARLARVNAQGTLDASFDPGADNPVYSLAVVPDGQLIVGGAFMMIGGGGAGQFERASLARLRSDGTLDVSFDPGADGTVYAIARQRDGRLVIGGAFTTIGGGGWGSSFRGFVARLLPDGTVDSSFDPGANGEVRTVLVQANGSVVLGGAFTAIGGGGFGTVARSRVARVLPDGQLDALFTAGANNAVLAMGLQQDGRLLAGGLFSALSANGAWVARSKLGRFSTTDVSASGPVAVDTVVEYSPDEQVWQPLADEATLPLNEHTVIRTRMAAPSGHGNGSLSWMESRRDRFVARPSLSPSVIGAAITGVPYASSFSVAGAIGLVEFSVAGRLPPGVALAPDGALRGVPLEAGVFPLTITAADLYSHTSASTAVTLNVGCAAITLTGVLPSGVTGVPYAPVTLSQTGGVGAVSYSVSSGALPAGLTVSTTGRLSGTPSQSGSFGWVVRIVDSAGCAGTQNFSLAVFSAPTITVQPAAQTVVEGSAATFAIAADGYPAPSYRWQTLAPGASAWTDGASASTYVMGPATAAMNGTRVRAVASNSAGSIVSAEAALVVYTAPFVTSAPLNQTVTAGQTATFIVAATGQPAATFQWQVLLPGAAWSNVRADGAHTGGTTDTLGVASSASLDGAQYRVMASNAAGSAVSGVATLTVNTVPVVTLQPVSQTALTETTTTFSVSVTGKPAPALQWQMSTNSGVSWTSVAAGVTYSGVTTPTLTVAATPALDGLWYRAAATNSAGSIVSASAVLRIYTPPAITSPPSPQVAVAGAIASFSASASGMPGPSYRWQISSDGVAWSDLSNGGAYAGANTSALAVTAARALHSSRYRVVVTNVVASVSSPSAALEVQWAPEVTDPPRDASVDNGAAASFSVQTSANPSATYRWQRSADGANWSDCENTGPVLAFGTTSLAMNAMRYRALAQNIAGSTPSPPATLWVRPVSNPHMAVEQPAAGATVGSAFVVSGWAVDIGGLSGPGVDRVDVQIVPLGGGNESVSSQYLTASYGVDRPDIAALHGATYRVSGFFLQVSVASPGTYRVVVSARSVITGAFNNSSTVDVAVPPPTPDPAMSLDLPSNDATVNPWFVISGWAIDRGAERGSGVDALHVWAFPLVDGIMGDGFFVGEAQTSLSRPDVAAAFGTHFEPSGFRLNASGLSPGRYRLGVYPRSTVSGTFNQMRSIDVTVAQPVTNPEMSLDAPGNGATVGTSFSISGWAVDRGSFSDTGVDDIHVWAFPVVVGGFGGGIFLGQATYGQARGDVGAVFGSRFTDTGFYLVSSSLPAGAYRVIAYAHSRVSGTFNNSRSSDIVVSGGVVAPSVKAQYGLGLPAWLSVGARGETFAAGSVLWRRQMAGDDWVEITPPSTASSSIRTVVTTSAGGSIWVGYDDGRVSRTLDGAALVPSWSDVTGGWTGGEVTAIGAEDGRLGTAYVAIATSAGGEVWMTRDDGASWGIVTLYAGEVVTRIVLREPDVAILTAGGRVFTFPRPAGI